MKLQYLALVLLFAAPLRGDTISNFSGTLSGVPGITVTYDLTVDQTIKTIISAVDGKPFTFAHDVLSGAIFELSQSNGTVVGGCACFGGIFEFGINESIDLFDAGIFTAQPEPFDPPPMLTLGYMFKLDVNGVSPVFVDKPAVSTPEPSVLWLMLAGMALKSKLKRK
jgi:hypothetical protein